ncbi:hypothetical protein D3C85_1564990 [compost metagenome]
MDVCVDPACGDDLAFGGDHFGRGTNRDRHAGLNIGITGFAHGKDPAVFDADIRLHDPPVIDDQRVGQHQIHTVLCRHLPLAHAVTNYFSAAELHLFTVDREIVFDLNPQVCIGQAYFVARRWTEHVGIRLA